MPGSHALWCPGHLWSRVPQRAAQDLEPVSAKAPVEGTRAADVSAVASRQLSTRIPRGTHGHLWLWGQGPCWGLGLGHCKQKVPHRLGERHGRAVARTLSQRALWPVPGADVRLGTRVSLLCRSAPVSVRGRASERSVPVILPAGSSARRGPRRSRPAGRLSRAPLCSKRLNSDLSHMTAERVATPTTRSGLSHLCRTECPHHSCLHS